MKYPGRFLTSTAPTVSTTSAPGIWTLEEQVQYQKTGTWPQYVRSDPQFNYVTMLLHGDGTNGAQNNTFLDSSSNAFTITRNGSTTQGTFSPYGSNWSNYLSSASGSRLSFGSSTNLALGAGDFTVEFWTYVNSLAASYSIFAEWRSAGSAPNGIPALADLNNNGKLGFAVGNGSGFTFIVESASTIPLNTWTHIAVVRSGTTVTMYWNGVSVGTGTSSVNFGIQNFSISDPQGSYSPNFYVSNFRIVKGTAVYTSAFTPSTTPLTAITNTQLLTCQSNRLIDNSSNAFAVTPYGTYSVQRFSPFSPTSAYSPSVIGGSGYFNSATYDYLSVPSSTAFAYGTGDFTWECWVYRTGSGYVLDHGANGGTISINGSQAVYYNPTTGIGSSLYTTGFGTLTANTWYHLAAVRRSGVTYLYTNGVLSTSASDSHNYAAQAVLIGNYGGSGYFFPGYISDLRLVKGTAVYTSAFTPPTAPLTAITNTQLLTNYTNAGILDNAEMNDLVTVGSAQISTSVVKYGTGSMSFNGSNSYLYVPNSPILPFGTGDFTFECWVYATSNPSDVGIFDCRTGNSGTPQDGFTLGAYSSSVIRIYSDGVLIASSGTSYVNTWCHVAVVRSSGTWNLYINGVSQGTSAASRNMTNTDAVIGVGRYIGNSTPSAFFPGYIDDLRITKGYARYTTNFTPPTAAFPNR